MLLLGMFLQTMEVFYTLSQDGSSWIMNTATKLLPSIVISFLLTSLLRQEVAFSIVTSLVVMSIYRLTYIRLMKDLPLSFTLGEASIVAQAAVVFLYNCFLKLPFTSKAKTLSEELSLVLQIGLLAVLVLVLVTYKIPIFRNWILFYLLVSATVFGVCVAPINNQQAITILLNFVFNDIERTVIVAVYIILLASAGFAVSWQINKNQKGTTRTRKIFHILVVLVFVPGLIYQCHFLYVASTVTLAIFIVLETARVIKLCPVADVLESSISAFIDEKDAGKVALTPIYLLVGCAAPLWIHNSPCDLTGSSAFELLPLLSGIISIGIGDTFASIIGSKIGRNKWQNGIKSVEGTLASILAQAAFMYALNFLGYLPLTIRLAAISGVAVISNALIEALTDQVDNLVLPIVTYNILAFK